MTLALPEIPQEKRRSEKKFWRAFDEANPRVSVPRAAASRTYNNRRRGGGSKCSSSRKRHLCRNALVRPMVAQVRTADPLLPNVWRGAPIAASRAGG